MKKAKSRAKKSGEESLGEQLALKTKLDECQGALAIHKVDLAETTEKLEKCNETVGKMQEAAERTQAKTEAEVVELKDKITELETTLSEVQDVLAVTTDELDTETAAHKRLDDALAALTTQAEESSKASAEKLAATESALDTTTADRDRLQAAYTEEKDLLEKVTTAPPIHPLHPLLSLRRGGGEGTREDIDGRRQDIFGARYQLLWEHRFPTCAGVWSQAQTVLVYCALGMRMLSNCCVWGTD